jgi:hypothetical protein
MLSSPAMWRCGVVVLVLTACVEPTHLPTSTWTVHKLQQLGVGVELAPDWTMTAVDDAILITSRGSDDLAILIIRAPTPIRDTDVIARFGQVEGVALAKLSMPASGRSHVIATAGGDGTLATPPNRVVLRIARLGDSHAETIVAAIAPATQARAEVAAFEHVVASLTISALPPVPERPAAPSWLVPNADERLSEGSDELLPDNRATP